MVGLCCLLLVVLHVAGGALLVEPPAAPLIVGQPATRVVSVLLEPTGHATKITGAGCAYVTLDCRCYRWRFSHLETDWGPAPTPAYSADWPLAVTLHWANVTSSPLHEVAVRVRFCLAREPLFDRPPASAFAQLALLPMPAPFQRATLNQWCARRIPPAIKELYTSMHDVDNFCQEETLLLPVQFPANTYTLPPASSGQFPPLALTVPVGLSLAALVTLVAFLVHSV